MPRSMPVNVQLLRTCYHREQSANVIDSTDGVTSEIYANDACTSEGYRYHGRRIKSEKKEAH